MKTFRKRTFRSIPHFIADISFLLLSPRKFYRYILRGDVVSPAFRERLMLTVTVVNGCRHCTYYHAKVSLLNGVSRKEALALLSGTVGECPENEVPALLYAQHWAENDGRPGEEERKKMGELYGSGTFDGIEFVLMAIRTGNLLGNTFDYILFRLSLLK